MDAHNTGPSLSMRGDSIVLLESSTTEWIDVYKNEAERIRGKLQHMCLGIQHIGSTAVHGLMAKPIIDIMVGFDSLRTADRAVHDVVSLDYQHVPRMSESWEEWRYLHKGPPHLRRFHLHLVKYGSPAWDRRIVFRDQLRISKSHCDEYQKLKVALAKRYPMNRPAYTAGKRAFIDLVVRRAI